MSDDRIPTADSDQAEPPRFVRALFGGAAFVMGALVLGAAVGLVPADPEGWLAPWPVIYALGAGLWLFAAMLWIPRVTPGWVRSGLALTLLVLMAVVCNWTAFAPGVRYTSTTEIGGWIETRDDPIGGRIVFGAAALVVNALLLGWLAAPLWRRLRPGAAAAGSGQAAGLGKLPPRAEREHERRAGGDAHRAGRAERVAERPEEQRPQGPESPQ